MSCAKYFPPNWAPKPRACAFSEKLLLELRVAERAAELVARRREGVVVTRRGELDGLQAGLGRRAADDDRDVVRGARGRAEALHLLDEERLEAGGVQERFRLLVERALVRRASALRDEEQVVLHARRREEVDLRRQVVAGVDLVVHRERGRLRVAEVLHGVGLKDALREKRRVVGSGPDLLALPADDRRRAGVLAERQLELRGDDGVAEKRRRHEAVVRRSLGILQDGRDLPLMLRPEEERHVAHRLVREQGERPRVDDEDRLAAEPGFLHEALRDEPVGRRVLTPLEGLRKHEVALDSRLHSRSGPLWRLSFPGGRFPRFDGRHRAAPG